MKCYETSKPGVYALHIKVSDEEIYSIPYMWLKYAGLVETHLEIEFTHTSVKVFGKQLLPILTALNDNKLTHITTSNDESETAISKILVERNDEEEFQAYEQGTE